ncbi:MAG: stage IV sporulation protein A [Clostridia bacterium]|nr:stage IV sporulation protein A [Clostridia bacterium]
MESFEIYNDIAKRTNGDIYVGVVGPVRTGKSTFISKFMHSSILDNIVNEYEKQRTIDEMPQSGAGKTVMTMQPKFIPSEAVEVNFGSDATARVRLVDCVGYAVEGANGFADENGPRMVKTPWSDLEMSFEEAAEIGTHKVISEHSTVAVLVTTDGTIADIPRENYVKSEERVVAELNENHKPFVIVLNSRFPESEDVLKLEKELEEKYNAPVLAYDISKMGAEEITNIIKSILMEFPIKEINFRLPKWIMALPYDNDFIKNIMSVIKQNSDPLKKMSDYLKLINIFKESEDLKELEVLKMNLATGEIDFEIPVDDALYYKTLSKECGVEIKDDFCLMNYVKELVSAKSEYDKIKAALDMVKQTGYGIVNPTVGDMVLSEPEIITKNGNSSLKLKATAPSLHIMRVDVDAEICPAVGSVNQSGSLVSYMLNEFENNKEDLWNKNMFGKPMNELVKDSIDTKLAGLPDEVQTKMRKTLTKIVNERKGGVICILL